MNIYKKIKRLVCVLSCLSVVSHTCFASTDAYASHEQLARQQHFNDINQQSKQIAQNLEMTPNNNNCPAQLSPLSTLYDQSEALMPFQKTPISMINDEKDRVDLVYYLYAECLYHTQSYQKSRKVFEQGLAYITPYNSIIRKNMRLKLAEMYGTGLGGSVELEKAIGLYASMDCSSEINRKMALLIHQLNASVTPRLHQILESTENRFCTSPSNLWLSYQLAESANESRNYTKLWDIASIIMTADYEADLIQKDQLEQEIQAYQKLNTLMIAFYKEHGSPKQASFLLKHNLNNEADLKVFVQDFKKIGAFSFFKRLY